MRPLRCPAFKRGRDEGYIVLVLPVGIGPLKFKSRRGCGLSIYVAPINFCVAVTLVDPS